MSGPNEWSMLVGKESNQSKSDEQSKAILPVTFIATKFTNTKAVPKSSFHHDYFKISKVLILLFTKNDL